MPVIGSPTGTQGVLTNVTRDPNGVAVGNLTVIITLKPGPGYKSDTAQEISRTVTVDSDTTGSWSIALEQNANVIPANSFYEVYEPIPADRGGPITSAVRVVGGIQTVYAARITNPAPATAEGALTQTAADARYARLGDPVSTSTSNLFTGDQYFGSGRPWFDVIAYGADPTGATDSHTAFVNTITAAIAHGGIVRVPWGTYRIDSEIATLVSVTSGCAFLGDGGNNAGASNGSRILYKPQTGSLFDLRRSSGVKFRDLQLWADHAMYSGTILDFNHGLVAGPGGTIASDWLIENCNVTVGTSATGAALNMGWSINGQARSSAFFGGAVTVLMATNNQANVHKFYGCEFGGYNTAATRDNGQSIKFDACTFEDGVGGLGKAYTQSTYYSYGLGFDNCWFGDSTSGTWIETVRSLGFSAQGCTFASGALSMSFDGSVGVDIGGCLGAGTTNWLDFVANASYAVCIHGNDFAGLGIANEANIGNGWKIANSSGSVVVADKRYGSSLTGWGAPTGTLSRATFDQSTVTLPQLAQRVAALVTDLESRGDLHS